MISRYSATKLVKKAGVRISSDAIDFLIEVLEDLSDSIAREAVEMAYFAGRRTVMEKDVEFAIRKMFRDLL